MPENDDELLGDMSDDISSVLYDDDDEDKDEDDEVFIGEIGEYDDDGGDLDIERYDDKGSDF